MSKRKRASDDEENWFDDEYDDDNEVKDAEEEHSGAYNSAKTLNDFVPIVHKFSGSPSVNFPAYLNAESSEVDFFSLYLDEAFMRRIVNYTNERYTKVVVKRNLKQNSRMLSWVETTVDEMYIFFALTMLMTRNRHLHAKEYWSKDPLLSNNTFSKIMPRDKYMVLMNMLSFGAFEPSDDPSDLTRVLPFVEHAREVFRMTMSPCENLHVQDIGKKLYPENVLSKHDVAVYALSDVQSNYIVDFYVYPGKSSLMSDRPNFGICGDIAVKLLENYLNKGHKVWMEEKFTNTKLFAHLHANKTNACGLAHKKSKGMAAFNDLEDGEVEVKDRGPTLIVKWQNKGEFYMLTTMHEASMVDSSEECMTKPKAYVELTENTKSNHRSELMISSLSILNKSVHRRCKKVAFYVIDMMLINSHALYNSVTESDVDAASFQLSVIRQLLCKYNKVSVMESSLVSEGSSPRLAARSIAKHMPVQFPLKGNKCSYHVCRVCVHTSRRPRKRKRTRYMCPECDVALCVVPCFRDYHSLEEF